MTAQMKFTASYLHMWQKSRHELCDHVMSHVWMNFSYALKRSIYLNLCFLPLPLTSLACMAGCLAPAVLCMGKSRMKQGSPLRTHTFASTLAIWRGNQFVWRILLFVNTLSLSSPHRSHSGCRGRHHSYQHFHLCGCFCDLEFLFNLRFL